MIRLCPLFKNLWYYLSFILFHSFLRYFRQSPHPHATRSCPNPTYQPSLHIMTAFKKIYIKRIILPVPLPLSIKNQFLIFEIALQIYQVILIYGIFPGSFLDNLEWSFFIKLWRQKKIIFLQTYNTILQRVKLFLNVKMVNIKKIKQEKSQSPLSRRPAPAPYSSPLFF